MCGAKYILARLIVIVLILLGVAFTSYGQEEPNKTLPVAASKAIG